MGDAGHQWTRSPTGAGSTLLSRVARGIGLPPPRLAAAAAAPATGTSCLRAARRGRTGSSSPGCRWRPSRAASPAGAWSRCRSPISARRWSRGDAPAGAAAVLGDALEDLARLARAAARGPRAGRGRCAAASPGERFHHHVLALEPDAAGGPGAVRQGRRRCAASGARGARACVAETADRPPCPRRVLPPPRRDPAPARGARRSRAGSSSASRRCSTEGLGFVAAACGAATGSSPRPSSSPPTTCSPTSTAPPTPRSLAARPNNLLFMEAIRWGCEHGFRSLDFGRTHWGQEGLRSFKLSWGAEERELRYRHLGPARAQRPRRPGRRARWPRSSGGARRWRAA